MNYTLEFQNAIDYATAQNLFIGFGNPNGKVLMLGKEQAFDQKSEANTKEFLDEIFENRNLENAKNLKGWQSNLRDIPLPEWDDMPLGLINPLYAWGGQLNVPNRVKEKIGNGGTSNTYLKYQKLYQYLNNQDLKSQKIEFQKEFFLTELNEIATKYSYSGKELKIIRNESIEKRKELFKMDFFKSFPITIVAAGHYPRDYGFDIEKIFDVKYVGEITMAGNDYYNIHYSPDRKRILIHTRQLSMGVTDNLLKEIAKTCQSYYE